MARKARFTLQGVRNMLSKEGIIDQWCLIPLI